MNGKTIRYSLFSAILVSTSAYATLPTSATPICPALESLQCKPFFNDCDEDHTVYCSGTWSAKNVLGKLFASRTDIDCNGTLISWLPEQSVLIDGYQVKCVYLMQDGAYLASPDFDPENEAFTVVITSTGVQTEKGGSLS